MRSTGPGAYPVRLSIAVLAVPLLVAATVAAQPSPDPVVEGRYSARERAQARAALEEGMSMGELPGIVAGITTGSETLFIGAAGVRRLDRPELLELNDLLHLGSCTKALTATLMAVLVESGDLDWDSSLPVTPRDRSRTGSTITLHQLLSHTAGVPVSGLPQWEAMPEFEGDIVQQRAAFTEWQLGLITNEHAYSNAGYAMAASMGESAAGDSWETLLTERLFAPLGVTGVFGWPAEHDPNQPWGHWPENFEDFTGALLPHPPTDPYEVPPIIAPAGDVSMAMADMLVFLRENLRGLRGQSELLGQETFELLHTPIGTILEVPYACGWMILPEAYEGLTLHMHTGSALTFFFEMVLVPERDFAVAVGTNAFSLTAGLGCDVTLVSLMDLHLQNQARREASDPNGPVENATVGVRFATIQAAVDFAEDGDVLVLDPAIYDESIALTGKDIVLRGANWEIPSAAADTVLRGDGIRPVVLLADNSEACTLQGLTLTGGGVGLRAVSSAARTVGCRVLANQGAGIELLEQSRLVIQHCVVAGNGAQGIVMPPTAEGRRWLHSAPDLLNCTVAQNGLEAVLEGRPTIMNSILYHNGNDSQSAQIATDFVVMTYSNVQGGFPGAGNIDVDPQFAALGYWGHMQDPSVSLEPGDPHAVWVEGDYHLASQAGRWGRSTQSWVLDDVTSPCVDAGDPTGPFSPEPYPNGAIINMGAYGGTAEASKSPSGLHTDDAPAD